MSGNSDDVIIMRFHVTGSMTTSVQNQVLQDNKTPSLH